MSHFAGHRELFNKPLLLTAQEIENPWPVVNNFLSFYNIWEIREVTNDLKETCMVSEVSPFNQPGPRSNLLFYLQFQEKVFEAISILLQRNSVMLLGPVASPGTGKVSREVKPGTTGRPGKTIKTGKPIKKGKPAKAGKK